MPTRAELDFAAAWLRDDHRAAWNIDTCYCKGPALCTSGEPIMLTPAGADLLATIETLGIDPETARADDDPPEPEERFCAKCGNTGEIPIIGEFCNPCPDCAEHALRQVFKDELRRAVPWKNAITPSGREASKHPRVVDSLPYRNNGWTLIDSEETAKRFVGKTVEVDAPAISDYWPTHAWHKREVEIRDTAGGVLYFPGRCTGTFGLNWERRGNVRLREVREDAPTRETRGAIKINGRTYSEIDGLMPANSELAAPTAQISTRGVAPYSITPEPQPDPDPPGFNED